MLSEIIYFGTSFPDVLLFFRKNCKNAEVCTEKMKSILQNQQYRCLLCIKSFCHKRFNVPKSQLRIIDCTDIAYVEGNSIVNPALYGLE